MSIVSNIVSDLTQYVKRFVGSTAPSSTPDRTGSLHFDTTNKKTYASYGTTNALDWVELGGGGMGQFGICQGRLTLESGVAVSTTDQTDKETLYFTPNRGDLVDLYNATEERWKRYRFTELSLSLASLIENTMYDVFLTETSGVLSLAAVAWEAPSGGTITSITNASPRVAATSTPPITGTLVTIKGNSVAENNGTWRVGTVVANTSFALLNLNGTNSSSPGSVGTGGTFNRKDEAQARATALTSQNGILIQGTTRYLGTIKMTDAAGKCEDSLLFRGVWNYYNRVDRLLHVYDANSISLTSATKCLPSRDFSHCFYFVVGVLEDTLNLSGMVKIDPDADGVSGYVVPVLNSRSAVTGDENQVSSADGPSCRLSFADQILPSLGLNYANLLMWASGAAAVVGEARLKAVVKA